MRHGDLARLANETGISIETLVRQREIGLDNPAYRFERDAALFAYLLAEANRLKGRSWLDVGADTGAVSLYLSEILRSTDFTLCDVHTPPQSTSVRHSTARDSTSLIAASILYFSAMSFSTPGQRDPALEDSRRIARRNVIVAEDPKKTEADRRWTYQDDPGGTYRGLKEWRALFILLSFSIVFEAPLGDHLHSRLSLHQILYTRISGGRRGLKAGRIAAGLPIPLRPCVSVDNHNVNSQLRLEGFRVIVGYYPCNY